VRSASMKKVSERSEGLRFVPRNVTATQGKLVQLVCHRDPVIGAGLAGELRKGDHRGVEQFYPGVDVLVGKGCRAGVAGQTS
jgi:hypothetical protein